MVEELESNQKIMLTKDSDFKCLYHAMSIAKIYSLHLGNNLAGIDVMAEMRTSKIWWTL